MKIYHANILYTPTPDAFEIIENGYIGVSDEGLVIDTVSSLPEEWKDQPLYDYGDALLIPAFNDLHLHAPQYRNMGLALDEELLPWLEKYTFPEEAKFRDIDYARRIYRRFVHELWMQGTMRASVFATIHPEATRLLADLFRQAGMGACIGLVGMDRNCPNYLRNTTKEVVDGTVNLVRSLEGQNLVRAIITPRFVPSCSPEMMTALGQLAQEMNLPVQSHLSENRSEISWVHELEPGASCYGDAYYQYGLLGQTPTLMAHCCYSEEKEMDLMRHNVTVVHCPTSNSNLASGIASVRMLMDHGIRVALGTDIAGGHYMSMLRIIQYAIQASKLQYAASHGKYRFLSLSEAFYLATKAGGEFFGRVGSFEKGYEFDALVVNDSYLNYDHFSLEHRIERYIYLGDDRDIRVRFCRGRQLEEPVM